MKKLVVFFALFVLISCSSKESSPGDNYALYGYVNIRLPRIKGMTECSAHPKIQLLTQQYLSTGPVLAYYLNDETHKQIDQMIPGQTTYNDYFMIYGDYLRENYHATPNDLELMQQNLEKTLFEGANFEQISSRIEEAYGAVSPGRPVLLEKYSPQNNVLSMIVLIKYQNETSETTVVSAVDCILIKKRLITLAYYIAYNGGASIELIKQKNDEAVRILMAAN